MSMEVIVSEELLSLGLTPNLTGFRYSKFIIAKILNSKTPLSMSALLLSCALKNECSTSRVDRAIRTAIDIMKNNGYPAGYFGPLKKITVSAFVFTIAERIRNKEEIKKELEKSCTTMVHSA